MNTTSTPRPDRDRTPDVRGWIILAWVASWSVVYVYSAVGTRFPWVRAWLDGWF